MIGAILSGIGSIGSAIGNLFSTFKTNDMNLRIARETNNANRDLYREQFADQHRLWMENNEYNDPSKQLARLRNAGLNPSLQNIEAGQAQASSVPSAAPMQGATMEAPLFHFGDIAQNLALAAQASKSNSESQGIQMDNQFKVELKRLEVKEKIAQIDNLLSQKGVSDSQRQVLEAHREALIRENWLFDMTANQRVEQYSLNNDVIRAQKGNIEEQIKLSATQRALNESVTALNKKQDMYFVQKLNAELAKIYQDIAVGKATVRNISANTLKTQLESAGIRISNSQARQILPYVVEQAKYLPTFAEQQYRENEINRLREKIAKDQQELDFYNPFNYIGKLLGSGGVPAVVKMAK